MKNYIYAQTLTKDNYKRYKSITSKQWQVYYYLLSLSYYNAEKKEDHRFIYKKDLNITKVSSFLGISRPTVYTAISNLIKIGLIYEHSNTYSIYTTEWVKIELAVLKALLGFSRSKAKNIDLLRTYLFLKKLFLVAEAAEELAFTCRDMVRLLGHDDTTSENYTDVRTYLGLLSYWGLIELKFHTQSDEKLGHYIVYHLQKAGEDKVSSELIINDIDEMKGTAMSEKIYNTLMFVMPEIATPQ